MSSSIGALAGTNTRSIGPFPDHPASYFRDPVNHPDVLATILETARVKAGYEPGKPFREPDNPNAATEEYQGFKKFLGEIGNYAGYVLLRDTSSEIINNSDHNCDKLINAVTEFIQSTEDFKGPAEALKRLIIAIKSCAQAVSHDERSRAGRTSYQVVTLDPPGKPVWNPHAGLYLSLVEMDTKDNGKGYARSQKFCVAYVSYDFVSSAIVADAANLAGSGITNRRRFSKLYEQQKMKPNRLHCSPVLISPSRV